MRSTIGWPISIVLFAVLGAGCGGSEEQPTGQSDTETQAMPATVTSVAPQSIAPSSANPPVSLGACGGWGAWRNTGITHCTYSWECPYCPPRGPCMEQGPATEHEQRRCKNLCPDRCETQWIGPICGCR